MRIGIHIIFGIAFSIILMSCEHEKQLAVSTGAGFDMADCCEQLQQKMALVPVKMIVSDGLNTDSLEYQQYALDTMISLLRSFDINQSGKGALYEKTIDEKAAFTCEQYKPLKEGQSVKHLEICREEDKIVLIRAEKSQRTLINSLYQTFEMEPDKSFFLHTSLINRWKSDTVIHDTKIYFNIRPNLHKK